MDTLAIIPGMQGQGEVILIIFVVLLLFGAKKLPELSRSLGKSLGEFKKGQRDGAKPDPNDADARPEITPSANGPEKKDN